jgi:cold shock CspA family protein
VSALCQQRTIIQNRAFASCRSSSRHGGPDTFFHVSSFDDGEPGVDDRVAFKVAERDGRPCVANVKLIDKA